MSAVIYLKNNQKKIESKYHQVTRRFDSKYELIPRQLKSWFNSETSPTYSFILKLII